MAQDSSLLHPYLRQLTEPLDFGLNGRAGKPSTCENETRRAALSAFFVTDAFRNTAQSSLLLHPLDPILSVYPSLSDQVVRDIYADSPELLLSRETPHLYVVLDDPTSAAYHKSVEFITRQKSLSVAFDGGTPVRADGEDGERHERFRLLCLLVATDHFIFLFDLTKMDSALVLKTAKAWLENIHVTKLMCRARRSIVKLESTFGVKPKNVHDVAVAEREIEKKMEWSSLGSYTVRRFRERYRNKSRTFAEFPDEDFAHWPIASLKSSYRFGIAGLHRNMVEDSLKQIVYLRLIQRCQMEVHLRNTTKVTERALEDIYVASEWNVVSHLERDEKASGKDPQKMLHFDKSEDVW